MGVISKLYWMLRTGRDMEAVTPAALSPAIWCFQLDNGSFLTVRRKAQPLEEGPTITTLAVIGPVKDLSHRTRETLLGRYWQLQLAAVGRGWRRPRPAVRVGRQGQTRTWDGQRRGGGL